MKQYQLWVKYTTGEWHLAGFYDRVEDAKKVAAEMAKFNLESPSDQQTFEEWKIIKCRVLG